MTVTTLASFAPTIYTSYTNRILSALRLLFVLLIKDLPGKWSLFQGRRNAQADVEGPFYVLGAPSREIEEGKGILASPELLKSSVPFLAIFRVLTPDGKPVPNVILDFWQADSNGNYYFSEYKLRGTVTTDSNGVAEVLTVPPGLYGPANNVRQGHIHMMLRPTKEAAKNWDPLTTQMYFCTANDASAMKSDFVNYFRSSRDGNVMQAWCIPSANGGKAYRELPELSKNDSATAVRVDWWNEKLSELHSDVKVVTGATVEIRLNAKSWF